MRRFSATIAIAIIISTIVLAPIRIARAQDYNPSVVPIGTGQDRQSIMEYLKQFTLDKLAFLAAKQVLHQLTVETVNWINSGFNGSPAYLTNPDGFLLDVVDQTTGMILENGGPLQGLCSPWSLDVRLALALGQTQVEDKRYQCTLSKVLEQAGNANIDIDVLVSGEFPEKGGWPAFIALSSENNPFNNYLEAHSSLLDKINKRVSAVGQNLSEGQGFMSWQKCESVPKTDASGKQVMEKSCTTQTPGSSLASVVQKQLDIPTDELLLADNINKIVSALISQMMRTFITKGLNALSSSGSGSDGRGSYLDDLYKESTSPQKVEDVTIETGYEAARAVADKYTQAVAVLQASLTKNKAAWACFDTKIKSGKLSAAQSTTAKQKADSIAIDSIEIGNALAAMEALQKAAVADAERRDIRLSTASTTGSIDANKSNDSIKKQIAEYKKKIEIFTSLPNEPIDTTKADEKLAEAQTQAAAFDAKTAAGQTACDALPSA